MLPPMSLEELLEPDHPARHVWAYVEALDLSLLYDPIGSRVGGPGHPNADPRILVALWLYATLTGVLSTRRLDDLCRRHHAFRWLAGGVSLNHASLAAFRIAHADFLEELFTHSIEVLRHHGFVPLDVTAQDGMRVRASAGAASFHRRATLEKQRDQARAELAELPQQPAAPQGPGAEAPPAQADAAQAVAGQGVAAEEPATAQEATSRQQAARQRSARQRAERAEQALARLPEMEAKKGPSDQTEARCSSTDPQATVMKRSDGGYRPAYNIHFDTDCAALVIVGVEVLCRGSDQGQVKPMLAQVQERLGQQPKAKLVDGGFVKLEEFEEIQKGEEGTPGTKVYAPVPAPKKEGVDRYAPHKGDSEEVTEWRPRMGSEEGKKIYKQRAATAECVNAQAHNRGLVQLLVRGLKKVKAIALWFAATHNMARAFSLLPQAFT